MFNNSSLQIVQRQLAQFAAQDNFETVMTTAFGNQLNRRQLQIFRQQWLSGNFSAIPDIQVLSQGELGAANGAYAASLDQIFVSSDFLAHASQNQVTTLILEELGHRLDQLLNGGRDSAGDEGEIFGRLVNGESLSPSALAGLKAQNDHGLIELGGVAVAIEKQDFIGDGNDNILTGTDGSDKIIGNGGNDYLDDGDNNPDLFIYGNDSLSGGEGNDQLISHNGSDTLDGGTGNDTLSNYSINILGNIMYGGLGDDLLVVFTDGTLMAGGAGNDTYSIQPGASNYSVQENAGEGIDTYDYQSFFLGVNVSAGNQVENILGGSSDDSLFGDTANNKITGNNGRDSISGGSGNDILTGGIGNDTLNGGDGTDVFVIDADVDTGIDTILETTTGGVDILDFRTTTGKAITLNLGILTAQTIATNVQLVVPAATIEYVYGGSLGDNFTGNVLNNYLLGGAGNDTLNGGLGIDYLSGGLGNDRLIGGDGSDIFLIDADVDKGIDTIFESATGGVDTIDFRSTTTKGIEIDLAITTIQTLALGVQLILQTVTVENAYGGNGNDYIAGNILNNYLLGGTGDDQLAGGVGNDTLYGNLGNDYITGDDGNDFLYGGTSNDVLSGGNGNDSLSGEDGDDQIFDSGGSNILAGGNGNDALYGGSGNDTLTGGAGNDSFGFNVTLGRDTIVDFTVGTDKIALRSDLFAGITNLNGSFNSAAFMKVANDSLANTQAATIVYSQGSGNLFYNPNGAASGLGSNGGIFAVLANSLNLSANDFVVVFA
jgi:Ca2+-binding RTX toxin-like protein